MFEKMINTRIDHDESQNDLAKATGYHRVQIARYETGVNQPPIDYLIKFCHHYRVSADFLLDIPKNYSHKTY